MSYSQRLAREGKVEIKATELDIVWGKDSRYWKLHSYGEAELIQVSWLEISGKIEGEPGKTYKVEFNVKVKEEGFGWRGTKVLVMAKAGKRGKYTPKQTKLNPDGQSTIIPNDPPKVTIVDPDNEIHFGLYEVWSGKWKGGLIIKNATITKI